MGVAPVAVMARLVNLGVKPVGSRRRPDPAVEEVPIARHVRNAVLHLVPLRCRLRLRNRCPPRARVGGDPAPRTRRTRRIVASSHGGPLPRRRHRRRADRAPARPAHDACPRPPHDAPLARPYHRQRHAPPRSASRAPPPAVTARPRPAGSFGTSGRAPATTASVPVDHRGEPATRKWPTTPRVSRMVMTESRVDLSIGVVVLARWSPMRSSPR